MVSLGFGCDDGGGTGAVDAQVGGAGGGAGGAGGGAGGAGGGAGGAGGQGGAGGGSASCVADEGCPPGARCAPDGVCRPACGSDDDCGPSARCAAGVCEALVPCGADGGCAAGAVCNCRGYCEVAAGDPCASDLSCDVADFCDGCTGTCRPRAEPCQRCEAANGCARRNDVCHPIGPEGLTHCLRGCAGQANCDALGPGYRCQDLGDGRQACVPESGDCRSVSGCAADGDCPVGHFCNDRLVCQRGCTADPECPEGQFCQGVRCAPPCVADADCGPNAACREDGHCGVPPGACLSSADCAEAETYCDVDQQLCVPGCQRDDDCLNANLECVGGRCRERGCSGNFQCAFGEVCNLETAQCVAAQGRHCEAGCDPMASDTSCGDGGQRCLSLQDEDENPLGDFCFEPCAEAPNACPQGYQCVDLMDQEGNPMGNLCIRRCDLDPFR